MEDWGALDQIREIAEEYADIDGDHHKQHALVQIAKLAGSSKSFEDEGIPA